MDDLIEALHIFRKYGNPHSPFSCEHDTLYVQVEAKHVSQEDKDKLEELGFNVEDDLGNFYSFRFGSS